MLRARFQNTTFRSAFIKKLPFNVNFNHITKCSLGRETKKISLGTVGLVNSSSEVKQLNLRVYV